MYAPQLIPSAESWEPRSGPGWSQPVQSDATPQVEPDTMAR